VRPLIEPQLPDDVELRTFATLAEALALAPHAEIGWFDDWSDGIFAKAPAAAASARWINTIGVGIDALPVSRFVERNQILTTGAGLMPDVIADFAVMGVLTLAKRVDEIVRAHDRQEWLHKPPGTVELLGSRALIVGYGEIGREIGQRLRAFGIDVTGVRRSADSEQGVIGPDDWRPRLAEFDWVVLCAPSTAETRCMIGAGELASVKPGARLVNIARGDLVDQASLLAALEDGQLGGAFLDVTTPEPLPPEHPLWRAPNTIVSMHLSGQSQTTAFRRGAVRFLSNLQRYLSGMPLERVVDLARGY
jgi:phosphoglycerate dehydrogenase-like enzyme